MMKKAGGSQVKRAKRTMAIIGGVLAVGTACACAVGAGIKLLLDEALDREEPALFRKDRDSITGGFNETDIYKAGQAPAKALREKVTCRVEITNRDGVKLVGHWYPCENAKRVVLAMHGWRSAWYRDFGASSDFWHDNGCSILYAEQRGQGESGGETMGFGITERYDCLDWLAWLEAHTEKELPIYLAGISMGATTVLMAAGLELPDRVHGIMADCGFTSPQDIWRHVAKKNLHIPYDLLRRPIDRMCRRKIGCGPGDDSTVTALQKNTKPVLLIHGTDDSFVPPEMTLQNYRACKAPCRLLIVSGAEHGVSYLVDREGYEAAVKEFWQEFD